MAAVVVVALARSVALVQIPLPVTAATVLQVLLPELALLMLAVAVVAYLALPYLDLVVRAVAEGVVLRPPALSLWLERQIPAVAAAAAQAEWLARQVALAL
jgi:hypothetical protein